jgi:hypothetical protein
MRSSLSTAVTAALLALVAGGAACNKPPPPEPPKEFVEAELGFRFTYPEHWKLDDSAGAAYRDYLARQAARDAGAMAELQRRQRQVVSVFRKDAQGRVSGRLSVFVAETTPAEFLNGYLQTLAEGMKDGPPPAVHEQKQAYDIGGRAYDLARLTVTLQKKPVEQELFAAAAGSQAVMFALTTSDPEVLKELKAMMWSVRWVAK